MLIHWIWLATRPGMNERDKLTLVEHFRDPEALYLADENALRSTGLQNEDALAALMDKELGESEKVLELCARKKIHILTWQDKAYPARLKNIPDPPLLLYYVGQLPDFDELPVIGVVGTRKASAYGLTAARRIANQITSCGAAVVSGMAYGIDAMATAGALAGAGVVAGVLGCGVDRVYPASNRALFADMRQRGCLISEFPPGTPPYSWNFPKRNRIISGLSCGVLVVEAPEKSGALITARQALEQGRDVFVVPGNIDVASCAGSNALLRDGAIMVSSGWDVVSEYTHLFPDKLHKAEPRELSGMDRRSEKVAQKPAQMEFRGDTDKKDIDNGSVSAYSVVEKIRPELSQQEQLLVGLLAGGQRLVDEVIAESGIPTGAALAALTMLEVKGVTRSLPGRRVELR